MEPTQRTLEKLKEDGYTATVAEYWQPSQAAREVVAAAQSGSGMRLRKAVESLEKWGPGVRRDLFGFVDVLAVGKVLPLGVQCTTAANVSARVNKILTECREDAAAWLVSAQLEVWGWHTEKRCSATTRHGVPCENPAYRQNTPGNWFCGVHGKTFPMSCVVRRLKLSADGPVVADRNCDKPERQVG
jgi:hypothetical protein